MVPGVKSTKKPLWSEAGFGSCLFEWLCTHGIIASGGENHRRDDDGSKLCEHDSIENFFDTTVVHLKKNVKNAKKSVKCVKFEQILTNSVQVVI